jgi:hypothetical protein
MNAKPGKIKIRKMSQISIIESPVSA